MIEDDGSGDPFPLFLVGKRGRVFFDGSSGSIYGQVVEAGDGYIVLERLRSEDSQLLRRHVPVDAMAYFEEEVEEEDEESDHHQV